MTVTGWAVTHEKTFTAADVFGSRRAAQVAIMSRASMEHCFPSDSDAEIDNKWKATAALEGYGLVQVEIVPRRVTKR